MNDKDIIVVDKILAGGIGTMSVNGLAREITAINKRKDGSVTLTIGAMKKEEIVTEDTDFEIVQQKRLTNSQSNNL